jgi:hypothetical protein
MKWHNEVPDMQLRECEEEQEWECSTCVSAQTVHGLGPVSQLRAEVLSIWPVSWQQDFKRHRPTKWGIEQDLVERATPLLKLFVGVK